MSKVDIWMPIYIGDYLRDTQDLTAEEHGAYLLILMHYWQKDGKIGSDISRLSRVAKSDEETTRYILETFFVLDNGNYRNGRADEEIEAANARKKSSAIATAQRWGENDNKAKRSARLREAREKGTHTEEEWESLKNHIGHCLMCGSTEDIVKDHIVPIYQGGSDSIENIQPLCRHCNASKGPRADDLRPPNWRSFLPVSSERLRNACGMPALMPAERLRNASSSSSSSPSSKDKEEEGETASPVPSEPQPPARLSPMKNETAEYWQEIITSVQPPSTWSNFGKERKALTSLALRTRTLLADVVGYGLETDLAAAMLREFMEMRDTSRDRLIRGSPVIPSKILQFWPEITTSLAERKRAEADAERVAAEEVVF